MRHSPEDDQGALELGNGADDDRDGAAQRAAGVELFAEADELDVQPAQLVEDLQEMFHRAGDSIRGSDQHDVEAAAAGIGQHSIESRTARPGPADLIGVLLDDLDAALAGHLLEVEQLGLQVLIDGGRSEVNRRALHGSYRAYHIYLRYVESPQIRRDEIEQVQPHYH